MTTSRPVIVNGQYTRNILKVLRAATPEQIAEGIAWYPEAYDLAIDIAPDVWTGAGVIAAYSPQTPWWRNKELAIDSCLSGNARRDTLGKSADKAQRILDGAHPLDALGGLKTLAFAENIATMGMTDAVTVDVHAYAIARGRVEGKKSIGVREYATVSRSYHNAAKISGYMVSEVQAITWVAHRDIREVAARLRDKANDKGMTLAA